MSRFVVVLCGIKREKLSTRFVLDQFSDLHSRHTLHKQMRIPMHTIAHKIFNIVVMLVRCAVCSLALINFTHQTLATLLCFGYNVSSQLQKNHTSDFFSSSCVENLYELITRDQHNITLWLVLHSLCHCTISELLLITASARSLHIIQLNTACRLQNQFLFSILSLSDCWIIQQNFRSRYLRGSRRPTNYQKCSKI